MVNSIGFLSHGSLGTHALEDVSNTDEQKAQATAVIASWLPGDHADILDMPGLAK